MRGRVWGEGMKTDPSQDEGILNEQQSTWINMQHIGLFKLIVIDPPHVMKWTNIGANEARLHC